jgi:hypothetical protein
MGFGLYNPNDESRESRRNKRENAIINPKSVKLMKNRYPTEECPTCHKSYGDHSLKELVACVKKVLRK